MKRLIAPIAPVAIATLSLLALSSAATAASDPEALTRVSRMLRVLGGPMARLEDADPDLPAAQKGHFDEAPAVVGIVRVLVVPNSRGLGGGPGTADDQQGCGTAAVQDLDAVVVDPRSAFRSLRLHR